MKFKLSVEANKVNINFEVEMTAEELKDTNEATLKAIKLLLESEEVKFDNIFSMVGTNEQ